MNELITRSWVYRVLRFIVNIGFFISIFLSGVYIVFVILNPNSAALSLNFDGFTLGNTIRRGSQNWIFFLILMTLTLAICLLCLFFLRNLINSLETGTPFTRINVRRIRIIGGLLLLQAYCKQAACYIYAQNYIQNYSSGGSVSALQPHFNILPDGAVIALCILILAEVFSFGCMLQHEHDTTV